MTDERAIGVFDSGVGGLTVLKAIQELHTGESTLYLGDTARVPYGNKAPETVSRYATGATRFLVERGVKAVVIACNTASAYGVARARDTFSVPVVDVILPVAEVAVAATRSGAIGVIGTRGTVGSAAYMRAIHRHDPTITVVQQACPLFVPLAEEGWADDDVTREVARRYLGAFEGTRIDTLILGCTHYPLLRESIRNVIEEVLEHEVRLLDSATATARALGQLLEEEELEASGKRRVSRFAVTDDPLRFAQVGGLFLNDAIVDVEHVDLPGEPRAHN